MISGRTPAAAARTLRNVLQRAVSCVSPGVLISEPLRLTNELLVTSRLPRAVGSGHLNLTIEHRYALVHDAARDARTAWQVQTTGYLYTLDDADEREIVAYHWHPAGRSQVTVPHLHLGAAAGSLRRELVKAHLTTGSVSPTALLALVIQEFAVVPRRADWATVLERAARALQTAEA